jgi:hypothetical protein
MAVLLARRPARGRPTWSPGSATTPTLTHPTCPAHQGAPIVASAGIRKRVSGRTGRVSYQVWWLLDDGAQGAQTVATKDEAVRLAAEKRLALTRDTWRGRQRGRLPFSTWAGEW